MVPTWSFCWRALPLLGRLPALLLAALAAFPAVAQEYLDPDFGASGLAPFDLRSAPSRGTGRNAVFQPDGKLVVVGSVERAGQYDWAVYRLTASGAYDASFSGDGRLSLDRLGFDDVARRVAIDASGRIIVAGTIKTSLLANDWAVVRLLPDGTLDTSFADQGWQVIDLGYSDEPLVGLAVDSQGRLILGGHTRLKGDLQLAFVRLDSNGARDASFGDNGLSLVNLDTSNINASESIVGLAVDRQDRILYGGERSGLAPHIGTAQVGATFVGRLRASDGRPDTANYAAAGPTPGRVEFIAAYTVQSSTWGDFQVLPDDGAVWTGQSWLRKFNGDNPVLSVARVDPNGLLIDFDGGDGRDDSLATVILPRTHSVYASACLPLEGGAILSCAATKFVTDNGEETKIHLVRFLADGRRDSAFGNNGLVTLDGPAALQYGNVVRFGSGVDRRFAIISTQEESALVLQVDTAGQLRSDFGEAGRRVISLPVHSIDAIAGSLAVDEQRLLVWGSSTLNGAIRPTIARVYRDGRLDPSFAGGGVWWSDALDASVAEVALRKDGRMVAALRGSGNSLGGRAELVRLTAEGALDPTFGENGVTTLVNSASSVDFRCLYLLSSGRILVGGAWYDAPGDGNLLIAAFTANGAVDTSWQTNGRWTFDGDTSPQEHEYLSDLLEQNGVLWAAGRTSVNNQKDSIVLQFDLDGNLRSSFADQGLWIRSVSPAGRADDVQALLALPSGGVLAVGAYETGAQAGGLFAARFTATGLDTTFANSGLRQVDIDNQRADAAKAVVADGSGYLIVGSAEHYQAQPTARPLALRLTASGALDSTFGTGGTMLFERTDFLHCSGVLRSGSHAYLVGDDGADGVIARLRLGPVRGTAPVIAQGASTTVVMDEDSSPQAFALTLSAEDADGDQLTWSILDQAEHGLAAVSTVAVGNSQHIAFRPDTDYFGSDRFVVMVSDGLLTDSIEVLVTIRERSEVVGGTPALGVTFSGSTVESGTILAGPALRIAGSERLVQLVVANTGTANLSLEPLQGASLSGLTVRILSDLPTALAPGQEANITLGLSATSGTDYSWSASFGHSAQSPSPFRFTLAGTTSAAPAMVRTITLRSLPSKSWSLLVSSPGNAQSTELGLGSYRIQLPDHSEDCILHLIVSDDG